MKRALFLLAAVTTMVAFVPNSSYAHRYFDSWAARWTMPDPALIEGNPQIQIKKYGYKLFEESPYGYCSGNPLKFVDPNGKQGNLNLGGPILLPTSWKQFEYNVVATIAASAVTAGMIYAPSVTATVIRNVLGNPAATGIVTTVAAEALAPPGASVNPANEVTNAVSSGVKTTSQGIDVLSQLMEGTANYTSGQITLFEKQLARDGMESLLDSRSSLSERLAGHLKDLENYEKAGGFTSKTKTEIRNFRQQINAIDEVIRRHDQ
jgi:RHS repeat-associated protein